MTSQAAILQADNMHLVSNRLALVAIKAPHHLPLVKVVAY
jgi:hypothetical protein